jgi:integrase/recombinase XerD
MTPLRQRMLEDLQIRHYSPTTIRLYLHAVAEFAKHFRKRPDQLGPEHIRNYQLYLIKDKQASQSTCIQLVCALRFFYTHTLNRKIAVERIPFPRRERKLPLILSREEVKALLEAPGKLRDRAVLAVLYGSGLRVAEVARLKPRDIDARRNVLWVRQGKGRKDRQTLLPAKLLELLRRYWREERPGDWLFPVRDRTRPIGPKAVYVACRDAAQAAGIRKPAHPHSLRHYAASRTMPRVGARAAIHIGLSCADAA